MPAADDSAAALRLAVDGLAAGREVVLATVLRTFGSSPRPPGSLWAIVEPADARPAMEGSVSGGCVEDDLLDWLRGPGRRSRRPLRRCYDGSSHPGLPCGGTLEVLVEWPRDPATLRPALAALERRRGIWRELDLASGAVDWHEATDGVAEGPVERGGRLWLPFGPSWRLLIVGAGPVGEHLARQGMALGFDVTVCDPRPATRLAVPGVSLDRQAPERVIAEHGLDARSAVVTVAHDPRIDDLALMDALESPAFHVAAMGSRQTSAARRARLAELGVPTGRLCAPAGLDIGSHTPAEIAVSIAAELVAARQVARQAVSPPSVPDRFAGVRVDGG
ncbi:MAG: XdhC family protein [Guyparkeria sp.]|uniref:XdhC family protein n=1 Tax=Guyparkeria sp. TaxID=2035736 RepID=UPI00397D0799